MEENEKLNTDRNNNSDELEQIQQHIMFSYSWEHKNNVRHIYDIIDEQFQNIPKWIMIWLNNNFCNQKATKNKKNKFW